MLVIKNLTKKFGKREILANLNFTFPNKGLVLLRGENGSGKTTLLNLITLNDNDFKGNIYFDNKDISKLSHFQIQKMKKQYISYVSQKNNLLTFLSDCANENLDNLKKYKIKELKGKKINYLSEGEQTICALERKICPGKKIYVFDEVLSSLDQKNQQIFLERINSLKKDSLVIVVSHFFNKIDEADVVLDIINGNLKVIKNNFDDKENIGVNFRLPKLHRSINLKIFYESLKHDIVQKVLFFILSLTCLAFCVGGTSLLLMKPGVAITDDVRNLPALIISRRENNGEKIENRFRNDIEYIHSDLFIYTSYEHSITDFNVLIDDTIKDDKIHLNQIFFDYLKNEYSQINSLDDLIARNFDGEILEYQFVIDESIEHNIFYVRDNNCAKYAFYLWLNDLNKVDVFNCVNKYFIKISLTDNESILGFDKHSPLYEKIYNSIYGANKISEGHWNIKEKLWLVSMQIFTLVCYITITFILISSIKNKDAKNIKILEREGFQRYEVNALIYGPYLLILVFSLIIGKILSYYLFPTMDTFGFTISVVPENFALYSLILLAIWLLTYRYSKRRLKWEI